MATASLSITLTQGTQSVANNTTVVTAQVYYHGNGVSYSNYNCAVSLTLDGTTYTGTHTFTTSTSAQLILTATKTVTHAANGTKTVSASASFATGVSIGTLTASASKTLTTIPRASQPTLSSSSVTFGNSVTIYTNRASSTFTHTLQAGANGHLSWTNIATGIGTSFTWNPVPKSWAQYYPSSGDKVIYIKCITYSGTTKIGEAVSAALTLNRSSDMVPTVSMTVTDPMGYKSTYGSFVQNKSKFTVTLTETLSYSSPIASRKITMNGATYTSSPATSAVITSTSGTISATITDQRGGSATATNTPTVLSYSDPAISTFKVARCLVDGTEDDEGTYCLVSYKTVVSPLSNQNTKTLKIYSKESSAANYTLVQTITPNAYTKTDSVILSGYDIDHTYNLYATLTDDFTTSTTAVQQLSTAYTLMDFHNSGKGMAIGKVSESAGLLEVDLDTQFNGDVTLDHDPATGLEAATKRYVDNSIPKSRYFGGSSNTSISASSNLSSFTTLPLTKGVVSTDDWSVSSDKASTTQDGVYKIEGYVAYAPSTSSSVASVLARIHIGSTLVNSRGISSAGGVVTVHVGPVIISLGAGTKIYWDISATVAGNTQTGNNMTTITAVRIG